VFKEFSDDDNKVDGVFGHALVSGGFIDAFNALRLILARFDVFILAGADVYLGRARLFDPAAVLLKGFRGKIHGV
jgi:hypothetical protein